MGTDYKNWGKDSKILKTLAVAVKLVDSVFEGVDSWRIDHVLTESVPWVRYPAGKEVETLFASLHLLGLYTHVMTSYDACWAIGRRHSFRRMMPADFVDFTHELELLNEVASLPAKHE